MNGIIHKASSFRWWQPPNSAITSFLSFSFYFAVFVPIPFFCTPPLHPNHVLRHHIRVNLSSSVFHYTDIFLERLDGRRVVTVCPLADGLTICNAWHGREHGNAVNAWRKYWYHRSFRHAWEVICYFSVFAFVYPRWYKEAGYERHPEGCTTYISALSTRRAGRSYWMMLLHFWSIWSLSKCQKVNALWAWHQHWIQHAK